MKLKILYTTKARKYKNTKFNKKIFPIFSFSCSRGASACAARPLFRVFVVNFFLVKLSAGRSLEPENSIVFVCQEIIDFDTPFRYKKASTEIEEAC